MLGKVLPEWHPLSPRPVWRSTRNRGQHSRSSINMSEIDITPLVEFLLIFVIGVDCSVREREPSKEEVEFLKGVEAKYNISILKVIDSGTSK